MKILLMLVVLAASAQAEPTEVSPEQKERVRKILQQLSHFNDSASFVVFPEKNAAVFADSGAAEKPADAPLESQCDPSRPAERRKNQSSGDKNPKLCLTGLKAGGNSLLAPFIEGVTVGNASVEIGKKITVTIPF